MQRVLKFVKYLPQFGYEPVVLTVTDADYPAVDESLLEAIPRGTRVIRTKIFEPYALYRKITGKKAGSAVDVENIPSGKKRHLVERLAEFVRSTVFIPDARVGWLWYAVSMGKDVIKSEGIDIIYSSSPPYTSALIAKNLQRRSGKPWVMGLRDPWTGFISAPHRWFLPAAVERRMERTSVERGDAVEIAWEGIGKDLKEKYAGLDSSKIEYIPNGFDPEDFPAPPQRTDRKFTITYTGSLYGRRNPRTLLEAMKRMVREGKLSRENFKAVFAGRFGSEVKEMLSAPELSGMIEMYEYLPHEESIKLLLLSDALVLIVDESGLSSEIVPGKVFEYIGARKPIIAFAPEGAAAQIIRKTGSGIVVPQEDVDQAESVLDSLFSRHAEGNGSDEKAGSIFAPNEDVIKGFERKEATRKLASLFTKILEK